MPYIFLNPDGTIDIGLVVIVEHPTGVTYAQQCGGLLTEIRECEGFLIPVGGSDESQRIFDWFWANFGGNCYSPQVEWTDVLIAQLSGLVSEVYCWKTSSEDNEERLPLKLDIERMADCIEAWIPVQTSYGPGVLTLRTCLKTLL